YIISQCNHAKDYMFYTHNHTNYNYILSLHDALPIYIDPSIVRPKLTAYDLEEEEVEEEIQRVKTPYDDLWDMDKKETDNKRSTAKRWKKFPQRPENDLLLFIQENSRELEDWQRDILTMMREEMLYFWPQLETKIMNEGWASYWHQRIIREMDLTSDETIEFATLNAGVV